MESVGKKGLHKQSRSWRAGWQVTVGPSSLWGTYSAEVRLGKAWGCVGNTRSAVTFLGSWCSLPLWPVFFPQIFFNISHFCLIIIYTRREIIFPISWNCSERQSKQAVVLTAYCPRIEILNSSINCTFSNLTHTYWLRSPEGTNLSLTVIKPSMFS